MPNAGDDSGLFLSTMSARLIPTLTDAVGIDGLPLYSMAHPIGPRERPWRPPFLRRESLEEIEIEVRRDAPYTEVNEMFNAFGAGVEFNPNFDKVALVKLAKERYEARIARVFVNMARYRRRYRRGYHKRQP